MRDENEYGCGEMKFINQIEPLITFKEREAVNQYLYSGGWLTEHTKTAEFEQMIADFLGVKYCVVVTSGTAALYLSLLALGIGNGDEVIVPDYTMIATPNAVKWTGAEALLCDVEKDTLCVDIKKMRVSDFRFFLQTKAMIYVPINGRSGDMDKVVEFCRNHGLYLIEDACQAFGSKWNDKYLGTFGDVGVFSFTPHKIITTGQGGAVVTDNKEIYDKVKSLKDFCRVKPGVDIHTDIGFNFKFTDLQAVVGIEQMKSIGYLVARKKVIYGWYERNLRGIDFIEMLPTDLEQTVPWFVDILLKEDVDAGDFVSYLKKNKIGARHFYPPIHFQEPYLDRSLKGHQFGEITEGISKRGVWLPSSIGLSLEEIRYVCDVIKRFPLT
jgi:perosamine synthetase